uniref:Uncharacterized protein n=1 Tax=Lotharella globosa TaxID=91324 RepID=A0A7S3YRJ5_9EUKA
MYVCMYVCVCTHTRTHIHGDTRMVMVVVMMMMMMMGLVCSELMQVGMGSARFAGGARRRRDLEYRPFLCQRTVPPLDGLDAQGSPKPVVRASHAMCVACI